MAIRRAGIGAAAITLAGLGVDIVGNALAQYYPEAPHWLWTIIFWSGVLMISALPFWVVWEFALPRFGLRKKQVKATNLVDSGARALAGKVNAIMERALRYDFNIPIPVGDPFLDIHEDLKESTHPIWTDKNINQLRRDFLQHVVIVGSAKELNLTAQEAQSDRRNLENYARLLMAKLTADSTE